MSTARVNAKGMGELSKGRVNAEECNGRVSREWMSVSVTSVILMELNFRFCSKLGASLRPQASLTAMRH